jgi:hypothetical protein
MLSSHHILGFPSERFQEVFPLKLFFLSSIFVRRLDRCSHFHFTRLTILQVLYNSRSFPLRNIPQFIIYFSLFKPLSSFFLNRTLVFIVTFSKRGTMLRTHTQQLTELLSYTYIMQFRVLESRSDD